MWHKIRKDGGSDGREVGFYFRNVTELVLFGVRGRNARTLSPGRRQVNLLGTRKRKHSRKPDEQYPIIQACSSGPFLELFARGTRKGWVAWGDQAATLIRRRGQPIRTTPRQESSDSGRTIWTLAANARIEPKRRQTMVLAHPFEQEHIVKFCRAAVPGRNSQV